MCQQTVFVEVASGGFYFGCKVKHLLSCSVSTGSVRRVIIALVYSVNVCQMDAAAAAAASACVRRGPPQENRKRKRRKRSDFLLQFYFHDQQLVESGSETHISFDRVSGRTCFTRLLVC